MAKYAEEVVGLFSSLEIEQIDSFAKKLRIDEVKILHSEILPKIADLDRRRQIRKIITEREIQLLTSSEKDSLISTALQQNQSVSDLLHVVFENITATIASGLINDHSKALYLARANDDELFILERKLRHTELDEQGKAFHVALEAAILKRQSNEQRQTWKEVYKANWRKKHRNIQWEADVWQKLNKQIQQINSEISRMNPVVVHFVATELPKKSWFSKVISMIWSAIQIFFYAIGAFISNLFSRSKPSKLAGTEQFKLEISPLEQENIEKLRVKGAQLVANITGISRVGERRRERANVEDSMMTSFGMVLASQMVSGTEAKKHRPLYTVIESLAQADDDNGTIERILAAVSSVNPDVKEQSPLKGEHACSIGGLSELVTAIESQVVTSLVHSPDSYSQYGLHLSETEMAQIKAYHENMEQSRDLTNVLDAACFSWGGYEEDKETHGYKKVEKKFDEKQQKFEVDLAAASKALQQSCSILKDGEALYLNTGLEGHAMQLVIRRIGTEFKLSTYDSSGALENTSLSGGFLGLIKLYSMKPGAMNKNAYSFSVSQDRLISGEGLDYLKYLIRSNSLAGWAQTHIEKNIQHTTREERSHFGVIGQLLALRRQSYLYANYMEKFASLASSDAPPKFEDVLQRPQNTQNCFAKKAQSCQLYELGKSTYKKLRLATMLQQKQSLLDDVCGKPGEDAAAVARFVGVEYTSMLKSIEPEYLSPSELHEVSMRLCEVKSPPSTEQYQKFFQALLETREKLSLVEKSDNKLAIERIDDKIASHAKALYLYLKKGKGNRQADIQAIFSPAVYRNDSLFNWRSGVMPLKTDSTGKVEAKALEKLSEHGAALAWKAVIQLINHQIKKLSVRERHIHFPGERLARASYRQASSVVTLTDLENANIVTFVIGFSRKDDIKIEINIGGERKEIDKATFFKLVVKHKASLTNPNVIGLLDYLRNASPNIEKRYAQEVYPSQRKFFEDKLKKDLDQTKDALKIAINRLAGSEEKLDRMIVKCQENLGFLTKELNEEQKTIGDGKKSVKLRNLELRMELLNKELQELGRLKVSVTTKIQNLRGSEEVEGSSESNIAKANHILERLANNDPGLQTINEVWHAVFGATQELEKVNQHLESTIKIFEVDDVEKEVLDRFSQVRQYRNNVITNYLEINADYRILDELCVGRMGTEKDRNRTMYAQSADERTAFLKQRRNTYLQGSLFDQIIRLNQKLKAKYHEIVARKVLLSTNTIDAGSVDSLKSANAEYINIDRYAQEVSIQPLLQEIKSEWIREMFAIWLKHESPERLYRIQKKNEADPTVAINQAFHQFIEQKANIKYAALKEVGYGIDLTRSQIGEMGWKPVTEQEVVGARERQIKAIHLILNRFRETKRPVESKVAAANHTTFPIQLTDKDLVATHASLTNAQFFVAPDVRFLSQAERGVSDGSTLKFLREHPMPTVKGVSQAEHVQYFTDIKMYLYHLKAHIGLENKGQRIAEFCYSSAAMIAGSPYPPPPDLVTELASTMLAQYRDDDGLMSDSFLKLENNQRAQILTTLMKLSLSQLAMTEVDKTKVNSAFYSILKQWEKLIIPRDEAISRKIVMLSPGGIVPEDVVLLKEVDRAIHDSPIGLEGLYEGQKGLQIALMAYGSNVGVDAQLRRTADRLGMRNGDALLAHQFIAYYSNPKFLLSSDGINSTQGRELFSRAVLDAFQHATTAEKHACLNFLKSLRFEEVSDACKLKAPHQVFIDEVLIKCSNIDRKLFQENSSAADDTHEALATTLFVSSLTKASSTDGADRLFGFAKEINILALRIEHALSSVPVDNAELDKLCAKLICSNLAYQLTLDQASEDILSSLNDNFEYTREMNLVQANIINLQENILQFSNNLIVDKRSSLFNTVFSEYVRDRKFDGQDVGFNSSSSSDIPGFIKLGAQVNLDVLHGVIYVGHNKLGVMPVHIQSHIALRELGIHHHPFKSHGGEYIYVEYGEVKASITPLSDGNLIIQRELRTLDGGTEMLQYIPADKMDSVPLALRRRLNVEHFFIDAKGAIHGYSSDFTPLLKLTAHEKKWHGSLVDHRGDTISFVLDHCDKCSTLLMPHVISIEARDPLNAKPVNAGDPSSKIPLDDVPVELPIIKYLAKIFPKEEMVAINKNTVYLPAIASYVIHDEETDHYFITDSLTDSISKRHLTITQQGSGYTEKVLTPAQQREIQSLIEKIASLQRTLPPADKIDLLSKQARKKIEEQMSDCEVQIKELTSPEYFVFVGDSVKIKSLETEHLRLRAVVELAYVAFKEGNKEREILAASYEQAKDNYIQEKKALQKAYAAATYLRTYRRQGDVLQANDFHSILQLGLIPGKTEILIKLLGENVPKSPLKSSELDVLSNLIAQYKVKKPFTKDDRLALIMMFGIELHHLVLEREACITGKLANWDRAAYGKLLKAFTDEVNQVKALSEPLLLVNFSELWRAIQSEFASDKELQGFFAKPVATFVVGDKKPIGINTKTTSMPIESMGGRTFVQFNLYDDPLSLVDEEQFQLEKRLRGLNELSDSIQAQEDGYYYENYGLFNKNTLEKLFSVTAEHAGIGGLTQENTFALFGLMQKEGWIRSVKGMDKHQLAKHPSEFYSAAKIESCLVDLGFERGEIRNISDRLETFLYQTAVSGGTYSVNPGVRDELIAKVTAEQEKYNTEYLEALDKIESIFAQSPVEITFADLNSAYLLNDYRSILVNFSEAERARVEIVLNNSMTRLLYYKSELDHINDVQKEFKLGHDAKAVKLLHTKRNYQLDKLLESELSLDKPSTEANALIVEQERKMQRAFLLFEAEFSHRCNANQENVFRSLLLDDETNPDKIDSAQARMGFGKTALLPLIALYKTGEKLVRFIVPKSALETNTADMSKALTNILGRRAVKDDFQRYRIAADPEANMGEESPRFKSFQDAKADLQRRLALYQQIRVNREVLVQAPNVRNSMECQAKIFLDMLPKIAGEPLQQKELLQCITILNDIRSMTSISIFDELDATQDSATTDVNYTSGEKIPLDTAEIYPLELITQTIRGAKDQSEGNLAKRLLEQFNIVDTDELIYKYITSLTIKQPASVTPANNTEIYLMRAILTDPVMLSVFTKKEAGTDFGVWFQNAADGSRLYDYDALKKGEGDESTQPLLIAIPYSAAGTPKPKGSRFDNPEVTAITTFLYYLDPKTKISNAPHLQFLIDSFRNGFGDEAFLDPSGVGIAPEFATLFKEIKELSEIKDLLIRKVASEKYFAGLDARIKAGEIPPTAFRKMLARTVIQEQIKFDAGKANSNRYEQGTTQDAVIGFSGTAGDTSSHFKQNMVDPAADGNMTLGIMGRKNCQETLSLNITDFSDADGGYTTALIKQLAASFTPQTRALIDVGGLCKTSNRSVAKEIAMQLKDQGSALKGVIFYDDVTNTQKLLVLDSKSKEIIVDLTADMMDESDTLGHYFTYYDQSHSRGADIKQMEGAHAVLTLNFTATNNDYKQAIMRMRKIIDRMSGQSFSTAVPEGLRDEIVQGLALAPDHQLTGNDIAFWLRKNELENNLNNVSLIMAELDAVIKNAVMQQQAKITQLMAGSALSEAQVKAFSDCVNELNHISPFISGSMSDLQAKYGKVYGNIKREDFIKDIRASFEKRMGAIFTVVRSVREALDLAPIKAEEKQAYIAMEERIIQRRASQLGDEFIVPTAGSALTEVHSEIENQSESQSQSQSQTQTHSFSEVANEEVIVDARLNKHEVPIESVTIQYLSSRVAIDALSLASKIAHMHHLFKDADPVRCSPAYTLDEKTDPPVRYFLAREKGNPTVILISQDEANLFKNAPVSPWSLYDIRFNKSGSLAPVKGPIIASLNEPLLKKLNFASFRYQVTAADLPSLARSLDGICTQEQLQPTLGITYKKTAHVSAEHAVFELSKWGFSGEDQQEIPLQIEQTQTKFKNEFEKRGVTVSVGKGEERANVFISSRLNQRILAEDEKQAREALPFGQPKLKNVVTQINTEYTNASKERNALREQLMVLKVSEKKVIDDFGQQIAALQAQKDAAISQGRRQIETGFVTSMKRYLNCRDSHEDFLYYNIGMMCSSRVLTASEYGLNVFGQLFPGLEEATTYCCNELYKKNIASPLSPEQLESELRAYIHELSNVVDERYNAFTYYNDSGKTMLEAMFAATSVPAEGRGKRRVPKPKSDEVKIWSETLENALKMQFYDLDVMDEIEGRELSTRKWGIFVAAIKEVIIDSRGKNLSIDDFHEKILGRIKKFATDHAMDVGKLTDDVMPRLCYCIRAGSKDKNIAEIKRDMTNFIKKIFLEAATIPSAEQVDFFTRIHAAVKEKIDTHEYELPARLLDFEKHPISRDEIIASVLQAWDSQNIHAIKKEVDYISSETASFLSGRQAVQDILDHYRPVENRASQLEPLKGQARQMFSSTYERLVKLDTDVLDIQKQIDEAKAQRKAQLADLKMKHAELRGRLHKKDEAVKVLHGEKTALNKLLSGVKKLLSVFTSHQVAVEQTDPIDFLDTHFNFGQIIRAEASASATLTFTPPEFYDVEKDMEVQHEHLHGLEASEVRAKHALDRGVALVKVKAAVAQRRECEVQGLQRQSALEAEGFSEAGEDGLRTPSPRTIDTGYATEELDEDSPGVASEDEGVVPDDPAIAAPKGTVHQFFQPQRPDEVDGTAKDDKINSPTRVGK